MCVTSLCTRGALDTCSCRRSTAALAGMGTEIAIPVFGPLILIGVVVLLYLAVSGLRRPVSESSTLGLGRARLAFGYLGVLGVTFLFTYYDTLELSEYKVAEGHVTQVEAENYFWGWFLNLFCLVVPFNFFLFTVLGLPLLKVLRRLGFLSVLGFLATSQIIALAIAVYGGLSSDNGLCLAGPLRCVANVYVEAAPGLAIVSLAFGLAARLPWLVGMRHAS